MKFSARDCCWPACRIASNLSGIKAGETTMSNAEQGATRHAGPPWIRPEIQQKIKWRDGDIVISVPPKSGTTWTMNIVHQLLTGGTADFRDIYQEVPWIEFVGYPGE